MHWPLGTETSCPSLYQNLIVLAFSIFYGCSQNIGTASCAFDALVPCELWFIAFWKMEIKIFPPKRTAKTCLSLTTVKRPELKDVLKETGKLIKVLICLDKWNQWEISLAQIKFSNGPSLKQRTSDKAGILIGHKYVKHASFKVALNCKADSAHQKRSIARGSIGPNNRFLSLPGE